VTARTKVPAPEDRGLGAVARVREVRERDSRLGLAQAIGEQQHLAGVLHDLERSLRSRDAAAAGSAQDFVVLRTSLTLLGAAIGDARRDLATAGEVTAAALDRWRQDKTRLSAVEGLLDRRAEERRVHRAREEAKELDEVAGRLWQRRAGGDS
jgi:flagellar export protein FliJ